MNYLIVLSLCLLHTSTGQFSNFIPYSELFEGKACNSDTQCRRFTRDGECEKEEKVFPFFFLPPVCTKHKKYTISGRCIKRSNPICDAGSKLKMSFYNSPNN